MSILRVFIAISLDDRIKRELERIQTALKELKAEVKWTRPEGMHLTLRFLGEVMEDELPKIYEASLRAVRRKGSFYFSFGGLGVFPNPAAPRVIWLGVQQGREELKDLAKDLEMELAKIGYPPEKREFTPHLTLGRVKDGLDWKGLQKAFEGLQPMGLGRIKVERIELFKSDLRPDGPVYTSLKEFKLSQEGESNEQGKSR